MPVDPLDLSWNGPRTSSWDRPGDMPKPFHVAFTNKQPSLSPVPHILFDGMGGSHGKAFIIRGGKLRNTGQKPGDITFTIVYDDGAPTESFSGYFNTSETVIQGTIKVKNPWSFTRGARLYANYRAKVRLTS